MADHIVAHDIGRVGGQNLRDIGLLLVGGRGGNEARQSLPHQNAVVSAGRILGIDLGRIDIDRKVDFGLHEGWKSSDDQRSYKYAEQADGEPNGDDAIGLQPPVGGIAPANAPLRRGRCPIVAACGR